MLFVFIRGLTGRVFKILPLKEEMDNGNDVHLNEYIASLARDASGALETFPQLQEMEGYITVVNTLQYISLNEVDHTVCKQEVFKMLRILNQIEESHGRNGGGHHA